MNADQLSRASTPMRRILVLIAAAAVLIGVAAPVATFPFAGMKDSFFGDNHVFGRDGFQFFTETKCVTTRWFTEADKKQKFVSTWEGTVNR